MQHIPRQSHENLNQEAEIATLRCRVRELEALAESRNRLIEVLYRINETFVGLGSSPGENIERLTELSGRLLRADGALYGRLEDGTFRMAGTWNVPGWKDPPFEPIGRQVIERCGDRPLVVRDIPASSFAAADPALRGLGFRTCLGQAVRRDGDAIGCLCALFRNEAVIDDVNRKVIGILAAAVGAEESRLAAKQAMDESELHYRLVVESIQEGLGIVDGDENILFANRPWREMLGYAGEEVVGMNLKDLLPADSCAQIVEETDKRKAGLSSVYEIKVGRRDGGTRDIRISAVPWVNGSGRFKGTIGSVVDITDEKRTERELREASAGLRKAMEGTIQAVAAITELRDPYTAGHQRRVAQLASAIAKELDLDRNRIDGIFLSGIIHDIGKIHVPAEILSKPGRLTRVEYEIIKTHARVGHDLLKGIEFPWPVAAVVAQHHERLDGSGYPDGLKDGDIILEARIMAVADVVEAMASHRPYRPALGIPVALAEIAHKRGTAYDETVADACLTLFERKGYAL